MRVNRTHQMCLGVLLFAIVNDFSLKTASGFFIRGKYDRFGNIKTPKTGVMSAAYSGLYYNHPGGARIVKASNFETEYEIGRKIVLLCSATGNPLPHITWWKDGIELYNHFWLQVTEWKHKDFKITSKMEIDPATQMDQGHYECLADNRFAIDRRTFRTDYIDTVQVICQMHPYDKLELLDALEFGWSLGKTGDRSPNMI